MKAMKAMKAREKSAIQEIALRAKGWFGPRCDLHPKEVRKLLNIIFRLAIDTMRETRRPFNLAGLLLLKPKVIKECKDAIMTVSYTHLTLPTIYSV